MSTGYQIIPVIMRMKKIGLMRAVRCSFLFNVGGLQVWRLRPAAYYGFVSVADLGTDNGEYGGRKLEPEVTFNTCDKRSGSFIWI